MPKPTFSSEALWVCSTRPINRASGFWACHSLTSESSYLLLSSLSGEFRPTSSCARALCNSGWSADILWNWYFTLLTCRNGESRSATLANRTWSSVGRQDVLDNLNRVGDIGPIFSDNDDNNIQVRVCKWQEICRPDNRNRNRVYVGFQIVWKCLRLNRSKWSVCFWFGVRYIFGC